MYTRSSTRRAADRAPGRSSAGAYAVALRFTVFAILVGGLTGCVRQSTYDGALEELADARSQQEEMSAEYEAAVDDWVARVRALEVEIDSLEAEVARLEAELEEMDRLRERATDRFDEAREEVYRLETLLNERGSEYRRLQNRLQSLSAIEREVRQRNEIYQQVLGRFQSLIDAGQLSVSIDRGRLVIQLPQDVLFNSGSATLGEDGRETVSAVGAVLADLPDRQFQIEGHTDDVPISTERFPSNWELSTARALSVVRLLVESGVDPEGLSGAGYGEFQPVASNETPEGRRRNRRIEIVMLPNLDVIANTELPN